MEKRADRLLIVDDEPIVRDVLTRKLELSGYDCGEAVDAFSALKMVEGGDYTLVLSDIKMPGKDGIKLLEEIRSVDADIPVIMVTAMADIDFAIRAMRLGAYDYITKPFNFEEVVICVRRALEKRALILENREYRERLEEKVLERSKELLETTRRKRKLLVNAITSLACSLAASDRETEGHSRRVAEDAAKIARRMSLPSREVADIEIAGLLHDIGKIGISKEILKKELSLTASEYDDVKKHPLTAEKILQPIEELSGPLEMIKHHHENYDGSGYPSGLKGDTIPLGSRILLVADAWDAMVSDRPESGPLPVAAALAELDKYSGSQFDPEIARIYIAIKRVECGAKGKEDGSKIAID